MREAYFHEDDYCQIEVLPIEALKFCQMQIEEITNFSKKHQSGAGWDDMFLREDSPRKLSELGITLAEIRKSLSGKCPEYDAVYTGYSSVRDLCSNVHAFGEDEQAIIFVEIDENEAVVSIWCSDASRELYLLPKINHLLLVDWGWKFVSPLSEKSRIEDYIVKREKAFAELLKQWEAEQKKRGES